MVLDNECLVVMNLELECLSLMLFVAVFLSCSKFMRFPLVLILSNCCSMQILIYHSFYLSEELNFCLFIQLDGGGVASGGLRELIPCIARTAVAVGVDGIFMEV